MKFTNYTSLDGAMLHLLTRGALPALSNLCLVWGVLGVPSRVLQQIAGNDWWHHGVVIAHANV